MRIAAISVEESSTTPAVELDSISHGLNAVVGPHHSGKTTVADLLAQMLFGKRPLPLREDCLNVTPPGAVTIESGAMRYRVRRSRGPDGAVRLTVAALDGSPVDERTIPNLAGGLSPAVLSKLCAVSFREPANIGRLVSADFALCWQSIEKNNAGQNRRRTTELAARRDQLAQELETRISAERRASKDLEARTRELDRQIRSEQQQAHDIEQRLRAVETALAETDARLRYRRLELNVEHYWPQTAEPGDYEQTPQELEQQIVRLRSVLAELAQREAAVRAHLTQLEADRATARADAFDHRTWLAVARQLAADLSGEIARLARSAVSKECVCQDAHPRLRPIAETIDRQLDRFEASIHDQERGIRSAKLQLEIENLSRSQGEIRKYIDHLVERRQAAIGARLGDIRDVEASFSSADAEQLESRRMELEQERFSLVQRLRVHSETLRNLRAERDTVGRERAAVLSTRSIEHVQRELNAVQQKLEQATAFGDEVTGSTISATTVALASDFLAQLTDGNLVQIVLDGSDERAFVVSRNGESLGVEVLTLAERDLVYLGVCLARLTVASRQGVWLPLVLDEPFERLDARATAALAAVLHDFTRQGHQVLVFTSNPSAIQRLASQGAVMHDITKPARSIVAETVTTPPTAAKKRRRKRVESQASNQNGDRQSDAA